MQMSVGTDKVQLAIVGMLHKMTLSKSNKFKTEMIVNSYFIIKACFVVSV